LKFLQIVFLDLKFLNYFLKPFNYQVKYMDIKTTIEKRRAYRSFQHTEITPGIVKDLAECAQLAPSCFNNQPWRYIFVYEPDMLKKMHAALSKGNEWAQYASMIIAVLSKKDMDCLMKDGREYYAYDVGMATGFMILRATEMELVAHPIAGYDPVKVKEILNIPDEFSVITLVIVGKHSNEMTPVLSEKQIESEKKRPDRLELKKIYSVNKFEF
jgi:nitroreductase